ncbi:hypothetical protein ABTJ58_19625, partial [Acinetobacter baumannii]
SPLVQLGRWIADAAALPPADFAERMRAAVVRHAGRHLDELEARAAACPPDRAFWARDMERVVALGRTALARPDIHLPSLLTRGLPRSEA